jgi:hypothetical protein
VMLTYKKAVSSMLLRCLALKVDGEVLRMLQVKLELLVGLRVTTDCQSDTFRLNTSSGIRAWGEEC